jgi:Tol biopolymer transport system component
MRSYRVLVGLTVALCVLVANPLAGAIYRVSVSSDGVQGFNHSWAPSISADGMTTAFVSLANNLVGGDTNGARDIFVHYLISGETTRVSVASGGAQGNGDSWEPSISADARYVAFSSDATNLVAGDTNGYVDVFVHDRATNQTTRVSLAAGGGQGNGDCRTPCISADGRYVAFSSEATNLVSGDTNGYADVFVRDRFTGTTQRVSVASGGAQANGMSQYTVISADGRCVAFQSAASNLVAGDTNGVDDIFVHDRALGTTERVSVSDAGGEGNRISEDPAISGDGRFVAFKSYASNLIPHDTNVRCDVFVRDRLAGSTERVSVSSYGTEADMDSLEPAISPDGQFVAFASLAGNLVANDQNGRSDIFCKDRTGGTTRRVTMGVVGTQPNDHSWGPAVCTGGELVAFRSEADNLVYFDINARTDVFVGTPEAVAAGPCYSLSISRSGYVPEMYSAGTSVMISLSDGVQAIDFTVDYDPAVLSASGVSLPSPSGQTQPLTANWSMEFNVDAVGGSVVVALANDEPMEPNRSGTVVHIGFIPVGSPGDSSLVTLDPDSIHIYDESGREVPLCPYPPSAILLQVVECPHPCDVNRDQVVDSADGILALQAAVGFPAPDGWLYDWPPVKCNDVNGNGVMDGGDAAVILWTATQNNQASWPVPCPLDWSYGLSFAEMVAKASAAAPELESALEGPAGVASMSAAATTRVVSLPDVTGTPGETLVVPIAAEDATGIAGGDFTVSFDPAVARALEVRKTDLTNGFFLGNSIDNLAGSIGISMANATGIAGGGGALVEIEFQVIGEVGEASALHFEYVKLYDAAASAIPVTATDGSILVTHATGFSDVPAGYWAAEAIVACVDAGIVQGYSDGTYRPELTVKRDQMATFISRAVAGGDANIPEGPPTATFSDVGTDHWAYNYVEYAYSRDIVQGYEDGSYRPGEAINRGQTAVFVARALAGGDSGVPTPTGEPSFADVTPDNQWGWCYPHVEYIADLGITSGYQDHLYHPEYLCTRAQMAVYVAKAFDLVM